MRRPLYWALFFAALAAVCFLFFFRQHPVLRKAMGLRPLALAAPQYVDFVGGSDLFDGTAKTHTSGTVGPWKSSPYMQGVAACSDNGGTHFGYTHTAGQQIIFKGGVTWPPDCFEMRIPGVGGTVSSPDYYGVDKTWFSGGSWTRPTFDLQGQIPVSNGDGNRSVISATGASNNITIDNLEIVNQGLGPTGSFTGAAINWHSATNPVQNVTILNLFIHDWTTTFPFGSSNTGGNYLPEYADGAILGRQQGQNQWALKVDHTTVQGRTSGIAFGGACEQCLEITNSHFSYAMGGAFSTVTVHDSEFDHFSNAIEGPTGGTAIHSQVIEDDVPCSTGSIQATTSVYNNNLHDNTTGVNIFVKYGTNVYNNVFWGQGNNPPILLCRLGGNDNGTVVGNYYNNTIDATSGNNHSCISYTGTAGLGTVNIKNNHCITSLNGSGFGVNVAVVNSTPNVQMTSAVATSQGYTIANKFIPTAPTNSTVKTGANLATLCIGNLAALCTDPRSAPWYGSTGIARPANGGGNWDSSAYQFLTTLSMSPSPVAFGNQIDGTTSAVTTVTVTNNGTGSAVLGTPFFTITGTNAGDFANAGGGTCVNGGTIAISGSCTVKVTFTPAAAGARSAILTMTGTAPSADSMTGTGIAVSPTVSLNPTSLAFGSVTTGTSSGAQTVTLTNTGTASLSITSIGLTGTNANQFSTNTNTCGASLAVNASCSIKVVFSPTAVASDTANLTFTTNASTSPNNVALTGSGVAPLQPTLSIAPSPAAFGNQASGTTSSGLTVTVTNSGPGVQTFATPFFVISGTNASDFARTGGTCADGGTLGTASCTIILTFTPGATGARSGTLTINGTASIADPLTGTGTAPSVTLNPTSIAFANQTSGTSSGNQLVTLTNSGTGPLAITSIALTGANANQFSTNSSTCGSSLAQSASCTLNVVFSPTSVASFSASLTFTTNASTSPDNVTLTGTGIAVTIPVLSFSPSPGAFGNQLQGTTSAPLTITVSNVGTAIENLSTPYWTLSGANASSFANAGTGTCVNGGTIPVSGSCTVKLTFTPSTTGALAGTLTINGTTIASDSLTGTGIAPVVSLAPSPAAFGNQAVLTTSSPLTVTLSNTGTASEVLSSPYFTIGGTNAADFANAGTGSCANGGTVAASSSCTINLTFRPGATGGRAATLNILGTVSTSDSLSGTGTAPLVSLNPTSIAFGNQTTGTTSGNHAVTLTNTGNASLTISSIALTGTNAAEFGTNGSTCGGTLAASAACSINVTFSPSTAAAKTANLTFTTSAASSPNNVPLTGTGVVPAVPVLSLSPSPAAFGNQNFGTTSAALTVTVTNTGNAVETLSTPYYTLTGTNVSSFANALSGSCVNGGSISVSGSCTIKLTFTPTAVGALTATLNVNGTASASDVLTGTGISGVVSLSPASLNFGNQNNGTSSNNSLITLTNTGAGALTITSIAVTGTNATEFSINTNTCGATLAASASCTLNAVFSPVTAGGKSASVTFTTNAASSPDAVTMIGTGLTPSPNPTPAPAITLVSILPPGSVVLTGGSFAATPRYTTITQQGCSVDGISFQSPCLFSIACGNCSNTTTVRWNGTVVSQKYKNGVIIATVPISLIPIPTVSTDYSLSLSN